MVCAVGQIALLCSASLSSFLKECGLPARMAARMAALPGGEPHPSPAAWGRPLSFPTSADWHGDNVS